VARIVPLMKLTVLGEDELIRQSLDRLDRYLGRL
jgi:hypothetical protein